MVGLTPNIAETGALSLSKQSAYNPGIVQHQGYYRVTAWTVLLHEEVERWYLDLAATDTKSSDLVTAAIDLLEEEGPTLGRPLVDRIHGSRHHNLKELRPGSTGTTEVRILFAFDPLRQALLLVAGDKSGAWRTWYDQAIPLAEERLADHLAELDP